MFFKLKKGLFNTAINFVFFFLLLLCIQNSSNKARVNLLINETVELPISFIIGLSFISGSLLSNLIPQDFNR